MNPEPKKYAPDYEALQDKARKLEALINLSKEMRSKERRRPIPFNDFLYMAATKPEIVFRDVFQLFHDMIRYYVPEGVEEYPESGESIGYKGYDTTGLFVEGLDNPFFADRIFANRLMNLTKGFRSATQRSYIYLFEGPPGSGKSTFLNDLLLKVEDYARTDEGAIYGAYWRLDVERLGGFDAFMSAVEAAPESKGRFEFAEKFLEKSFKNDPANKYVQFSCPNRDHPIALIPKQYRKKFLDELIPDENFKKKLFKRKEYEWALKSEPCHICRSVYSALMDALGEPLDVFSALNARKIRFNRQYGEGISVYNPGDPAIQKPLSNPNLEKMINRLLKTDELDFIYSHLAKTNNGILALMDIKDQNVTRLKNLHGIISDGVHKVGLIEEKIKTLFVGLINPEDKVHYEKIESFKDRIISVRIPYILDYKTEVAIYKNKFGSDIEKSFLPGVLNNFAKIIISTRMERDSAEMKRWITKPQLYSKHLDRDMLLLKMDIYSGTIPDWLTDADLKRFDKKRRKEIIAAAEKEGFKGVSGRKSLNVFNKFFNKYGGEDDPITMETLKKFFAEDKNYPFEEIPPGFVDSLEDLYDYNVLQQVKESIYYYNEDQIARDIKNYLFALNYDLGETKKNDDTGDEIEIDEDYFKNFEALFLGATSTPYERRVFRNDAQKEYITKTIAQEIGVQGKPIEKTSQFQALFARYVKHLKENALAPYAENDNFRRAIREYGTPEFQKYDGRLRRDAGLLIENLRKKFGYSLKGAISISLYVVDNKLSKKY